MKKSLRKLIPTFVMLVITAALIGTSTFAWFSMNNKVTVTGMEVTTKVSSNLLIADTAIGATTKATESSFNNELKKTVSAKLEPVSTIDGVNFFYTTKAQADGDAIEDVYTAYTPADTSAFNTAYNVTGYVGYADYVFQLKAVNTADSAQYINFNKINLVYNGDDTDALPAFRIAIFYDKFDAAFPEAPATSPSANYDSTTLLGNAASDNQTTGEAVDSTTSTGSVTYADAMTGITVAANSTEYYKVVVRLWIEGEDKACTSEVFAELNSYWALDLEIALEDEKNVATSPSSGEKAGVKITNAKYAITASDYTPTATGKVTIETTDYNVVTGLKYNTDEQVYTTATADTAMTASAKLFVYRSSVMVEVTDMYAIS